MPLIPQLLLYFLFVVPSAIFHEYSHGWIASRLGDQTAKYAGRLTLNPLAHIDMVGTVFLPIFLFFISNGGFMFAYAKPVPYNPYNLRGGRWGPALVGAAGPLSNLLLAGVVSLIIHAIGSTPLALILAVIVQVNILLAVFNLVPIPPLDGSKVLFAFLPEQSSLREVLERYGFIVLLFFIFFAFEAIAPIIAALNDFFLGPGLSSLFR